MMQIHFTCAYVLFIRGILRWLVRDRRVSWETVKGVMNQDGNLVTIKPINLY